MGDGTALGPPAFGWELPRILVAVILAPVLAALAVVMVLEFVERRGHRA